MVLNLVESLFSHLRSLGHIMGTATCSHILLPLWTDSGPKFCRSTHLLSPTERVDIG